jgi:hypothetical protein
MYITILYSTILEHCESHGFISIPGFLRENKTQIEISGIYLMSVLQNIFSPFSTSGKYLYSSII